LSDPEGLPGRWLDLRLVVANGGVGFGPGLGWIAGALASGVAFWPWPRWGHLLLGLFVTAVVWGRLWVLLGEPAGGRPAKSSNPDPSPDSAGPFPYTVPGSLSASWARAWRDGALRLRAARGWVLEVLTWSGFLLLVSGLWGSCSLLIGGVGLALLLLRRLVRGRPVALDVLRAFAGLAWPWWLGHTAWAPLTASSLLLSMLWGVAYTAWVNQARTKLLPCALVLTNAAQGVVVVILLLLGRPVVASIVAFTLFGQVLLPAGLIRSGRGAAVARSTWPFAAVGLLFCGLALGGWV
jgi:hypothetical protein